MQRTGHCRRLEEVVEEVGVVVGVEEEEVEEGNDPLDLFF